MGYGFAGYFGFAKESTWGSAQNASQFVEILNEDVHMEIDRFSYKNVIATLATPDDQAGIKRIGGSFSFAVHPQTVPYFLWSLFQTKSSSGITGGTGSLYNHSFTQPTNSNSAFSSNAPSQPLTLEVFRDVSSYAIANAVQYIGCLVDELSINFTPNQEVRASVGVIGRSEGYATPQTPTFPGSPTKPFMFDAVSLQLAGAATTRIEALNVSIKNNYEGIPALDLSTWISKIRRSDHQMVEVSGTIDFIDQKEYNDFVNQTEVRLVVSATAANSFKLTMDIPRMVYTSFPVGIPGKERITVDFEGKGFYHVGSGTGIKVDITNVSST